MSSMENYSNAVKAEREAWEAVRFALPGCRGFDVGSWLDWCRAVDRSNEALLNLHKDTWQPGFTSHAPVLGSRRSRLQD
jgi:hypothetical protein